MSVKIPKTQYPVSEVVKSRWSARAFSAEPISDDVISTLFEAASWAPSSINEQPWLFTYAHHEDKEAFEKFVSCLSGGNAPWAKNASVLVLCCARKTHASNGAPNKYYMFDSGSATTLLLIEAIQYNIYGHIMGGFDVAKTKEIFELPDDIEPVAFLALGKITTPDNLIEPFKTREVTARTRKPLNEFVFKNHF